VSDFLPPDPAARAAFALAAARARPGAHPPAEAMPSPSTSTSPQGDHQVHRPPLTALTVHQPFAWAIAGGWKPVENREWPPPAGLFGRYIAIHAGRRYDEAAAAELAEGHQQLGLPGSPPHAGTIPLGTIVAVARLAGAILVDELVAPTEWVRKVLGDVSEQRALELSRSPWATGPWLWVLQGVVAIDPPIPCRGFRKLWTVPGAEADQVRAAWRTAKRTIAA
jgi:hypothetical protein